MKAASIVSGSLRHSDANATIDPRKELPMAIAAAHALWLHLRESVPLEWLLVIAARAVRNAAERNDRRALDFASPILARMAAERRSPRPREAA